MKIFRNWTRKRKEKLAADSRRYSQIKAKNYLCESVSICSFIFQKSLFILYIPVNYFPLRLCVSALKILLIFSVISAQTGVLIPSSSSDKPDPSELSAAVCWNSAARIFVK